MHDRDTTSNPYGPLYKAKSQYRLDLTMQPHNTECALCSVCFGYRFISVGHDVPGYNAKGCVGPSLGHCGLSDVSRKRWAVCPYLVVRMHLIIRVWNVA